MRKVFSVVLLSIAASVGAQTISVGDLPAHSTTGFGNPGSPLTIIDLSHPLTADASLTTATVRWYVFPTSGCASAYEIKIVRPLNLLGSFSVVDSRGPFNATMGFPTVTLSPPIIARKGDLIAVTQLQPSTCGSVHLTAGPESELTLLYTGNPINGSTISSGTLYPGLTLNARASTTTSYLGGVIPGAGSITGNFGAQFKTSLQLTNPEFGTIAGTLTFHPDGQAAAPGDPSMTYSLNAGQTVSYPDVAAQMGASGVGSIDVLVTAGARPVATARVFNDTGANGTFGFNEELVPTRDFLTTNEYAVLPVPTDLSAFRMNIGIRTLDQPVEVLISNVNAGGSAIGSSITRDYPANYFHQIGASDFLGTSPFAGGTIVVQITSGKAIIFSSTLDNKTSDSSLRIGGRD